MAGDNNKVIYRVFAVYVFVILFALVIIGRILQLQILEKDQWKKANMVTYALREIPATRGDICDATGKILSTSVTWYEIAIDMRVKTLEPYFNHKSDSLSRKVDSLAVCLHKILPDKSTLDYKKELYSKFNRKEQMFLKKEFSYAELKQVMKFPILRTGQNKGGLVYNAHTKRIFPFNSLASRTIGKTDDNGNGLLGLEGAYNTILKGEEGMCLMQKLSKDIWMPVNSPDDIEPKNGLDVETTIDINFQDIANSALQKQLEKHKAHHGTAVVMEVASGEIRAIANLTDTMGKYQEYYNYAFGNEGCTEPGSTFKLASLMIALEDGYIDLNDTFNTRDGTINYYGKEMKDSHEGGYGKISVQKIFENSSNVGVSSIIKRFYEDKQQKFVDHLYAMNLNTRLGLDLKGEGTPYIKSPTDKSWSRITLPWMSIGYELRITPLQLLTFYNSVANNGIMVKPRFVKCLKNKGTIVKKFDTEVINPNICSKETLGKVKKLLEGVVQNGTAKNLKDNNLKIAGKTGTAKIALGSTGYENSKKYQSSFVGYFPADNPKYSCIVVVNDPTMGVYYGAIIAGEVFKEIADRIYACSFDLYKEADSSAYTPPLAKSGYKWDIDNVLKSLSVVTKPESSGSNWIATNASGRVIEYKKQNIRIDGSVPNVKGMGARDAIYILENAGLEVQVSGRGEVKNQSLPEGTRIRKGDRIKLFLG
ncbi:MAG: penicillin-binding protein [Bacteroidia bacterium]|nr:penicillin-binding protein [Bacteroidia bacterium]